jgi:hypothetical protein
VKGPRALQSAGNLPPDRVGSNNPRTWRRSLPLRGLSGTGLRRVLKSSRLLFVGKEHEASTDIRLADPLSPRACEGINTVLRSDFRGHIFSESPRLKGGRCDAVRNARFCSVGRISCGDPVGVETVATGVGRRMICEDGFASPMSRYTSRSGKPPPSGISRPPSNRPITARRPGA